VADTLRSLIAAELDVAVDARISDFAAAIAAPYGDAARVVLFYGSCLRSEQLVGEMLDFYLIVSDYDAAFARPWMAKWNRRLPPNVFPVTHADLMGKVAVLDEADFYRLNRADANAVSVWARFSQPARLVWTKDVQAEAMAVDAVCGAAPTLLNFALAQLGRPSNAPTDIVALWEAGYALTYSAELRAERKERARSVVAFDEGRFREFGHAALPHCALKTEVSGDTVRVAAGQDAAAQALRNRWPKLRRNGKLLTIARLTKAAFTYQGGIDYLSWKINRHAGTNIAITPWQRRHPFLTALYLVPKLWLGGAIK
jgi:hypothetical protein